MAKYIIEVPDNTQWIQWMNVSEKDGSACFDYKAPEDLTPYVRSESYIDGLKKGQNEVWEFVRMFSCLGNRAISEIGDDKNTTDPLGLIEKYSYQETKTRYESWKAEKDKICVGDEVCYVEDHQKKIVVTNTYSDGFDAIDNNGNLYINRHPAMWKKTGRHFDEVEELLKKMGDEK